MLEGGRRVGVIEVDLVLDRRSMWYVIEVYLCWREVV